MAEYSVKMCLSIFPKSKTLDEVEKAIGIKDAKVNRAGEILANGVTRNRDVWRLCSPSIEEKSDLFSHWFWIVSRLKGREEKIMEIISSESVELACIIEAYSRVPDIVVTPEIGESLYEMRLPLKIVIYCDLAGVDFDREEVRTISASTDMS